MRQETPLQFMRLDLSRSPVATAGIAYLYLQSVEVAHLFVQMEACPLVKGQGAQCFYEYLEIVILHYTVDLF